MELSSAAFADGDTLPQRFTCDGANLSPPLEWTGVPDGARSLALFCDDPDAPDGTFRHWAAYDISPDATVLDEGAAETDTLKQAVNDFGRSGYGSPCPPRGHPPHRYRFRLVALSTAKLDVPPGASCREIARAVAGHLLDEATLTGRYGRP